MLIETTQGKRKMGRSAYAAAPPNQPQRCILTDYFNKYNFSKAQIIRSLMMVNKPKHVGAVLT